MASANCVAILFPHYQRSGRASALCMAGVSPLGASTFSQMHIVIESTSALKALPLCRLREAFSKAHRATQRVVLKEIVIALLLYSKSIAKHKDPGSAYVWGINQNTHTCAAAGFAPSNLSANMLVNPPHTHSAYMPSPAPPTPHHRNCTPPPPPPQPFPPLPTHPNCNHPPNSSKLKTRDR